MTTPLEATVVQPGWYPDREDRGLERYWNGAEWANDWRPRQPLAEAQRRDILQQAVATWVAQTGAKVEYQDDQRAVLGLYDKPNHVLHGVLSVITLGLWLIVWLLVVIFAGKPKRFEVTVDEFGNVVAPDAPAYLRPDQASR